MREKRSVGRARRAARDVLGEYRKKRRFAKTPEPSGSRRRKRAGFLYVVQRHEARRLHYDFRLELDGTLMSWAVPKEPSLDPSVKRLAVETEPHPLEYGSFEGRIPAGQYGAGDVEIWDRGEWEPEGDPREGYEKGRMTFRIHGERLKGRFHLVRTAALGGKKQNWLLFKGSDASALGRRVAMPSFVEPELATLVREAPAGSEWVHEVKLDGYRILANLHGSSVQLLTRRGNDWTARMPAIAKALGDIGVSSAIFDGELVVFDDRGVSSFQRLQNALGRSDAELVYCVFDILYLDGRDLTTEPLEERKRILATIMEPVRSPLLQYSKHLAVEGKKVFAKACELGVEGIVSKRRTSTYRSGRGRDWLKVKCVDREEFVIVGYTDPSGDRSGIGALLLGTRDAKRKPLEYVGKVGTGFTEASLRELHAMLEPLEQKATPIGSGALPRSRRGVHWVSPRLVAEVEYSELTRGGALRHPVFRGLRVDKPSAEVVRESTSRIPSKR